MIADLNCARTSIGLAETLIGLTLSLWPGELSEHDISVILGRVNLER
jgi:hypothetical protein